MNQKHAIKLLNQSIVFGLLLAVLLSACQTPRPASQPVGAPPAASIPTPLPAAVTSEITGRVVDLDGNPIDGAVVSSDTGSAQSDAQGWFTVPGSGTAQWLTVTHPAYISRTRAGAPGAPLLFRLTPDDGKTIVIHFVGDTMFGRRFFDPNEDGDTSDGLLPTTPTLSDHAALLAPIQPLLANADLTVINMESPLSEQPYISPRDTRPQAFHETKEFVFASHPSSIPALQQAGVDVISLGNNHLYDLLETGLKDTLQTLDTVGLPHFGAGADEAAAWQPALISMSGQTLAFIGCTTISAPVPPVSDHDVTYTASDRLNKGGAAECEANALRNAIQQARASSDMVIVMIHGGYEYDRSPSPRVVEFTALARQAGADLIINHHPHVVGGLDWDGVTLAANSLGNFIFDQTIWPTFESYLLAVTIRDGEVIRVYAEPLGVVDYVSRGLTGELAGYVSREAAGLVPGPFVMENGAVEVDFRAQALRRVYTVALDDQGQPGQLIAIPENEWISQCVGSGSLRPGRDLLWVGGFENQSVDGSAAAPLFWMPGDSVQFGSQFAYAGLNGLRLSRGSTNVQDVVTTHLHRVLVDGGSPLTVTGMLRASAGAILSLQISWYPDTLGPSASMTHLLLNVTAPDTWEPFRLDVEAPPGTVAAGIYIRMSPPVNGTATADFDNLRLIEWAPEGTPFSPLYDYGQLTGACEATYYEQVLPGAEFDLFR